MDTQRENHRSMVSGSPGSTYYYISDESTIGSQDQTGRLGRTLDDAFHAAGRRIELWVERVARSDSSAAQAHEEPLVPNGGNQTNALPPGGLSGGIGPPIQLPLPESTIIVPSPNGTTAPVQFTSAHGRTIPVVPPSAAWLPGTRRPDGPFIPQSTTQGPFIPFSSSTQDQFQGPFIPPSPHAQAPIIPVKKDKTFQPIHHSRPGFTNRVVVPPNDRPKGPFIVPSSGVINGTYALPSPVRGPVVPNGHGAMSNGVFVLPSSPYAAPPVIPAPPQSHPSYPYGGPIIPAAPMPVQPVMSGPYSRHIIPLDAPPWLSSSAAPSRAIKEKKSRRNKQLV